LRIIFNTELPLPQNNNGPGRQLEVYLVSGQMKGDADRSLLKVSQSGEAFLWSALGFACLMRGTTKPLGGDKGIAVFMSSASSILTAIQNAKYQPTGSPR
jgi:hypothetical protein